MESPRNYQIVLYNLAIDQNIIAVLPTGTGKTLVSILLIKKYLNDYKNKKKIVFLAPTIPLVVQQSDYIKEQINNINIGTYCGNVESCWSSGWINQIKNQDIIVMTPMILYNFLITAYMSLEDISLLIFDECHHCTKYHPYNLIFKDFYYDIHKDKRPRIFGMTASPINKSISNISLNNNNNNNIQNEKCIYCDIIYSSNIQKLEHENGKKHKNRKRIAELRGIESLKFSKTKKSSPILSPKNIIEEKIQNAISKLENRMNCKLVTPDNTMVQAYTKSPNEYTINYNIISNNSCKNIIDYIQLIFFEENKNDYNIYYQIFPNLSYLQINCDTKENPIVDILILLFKEIGIIPFYLYIQQVLKKLLKTKSNNSKYAKYKDKLNEIKLYFENIIKELSLSLSPSLLLNNLYSPKFISLFNIINNFNNYKCKNIQQRMIIFADERIMVKVLYLILLCKPLKIQSDYIPLFNIPIQSQKVDFLLGGTTLYNCRELLENFNNGSINILVATTIAEEGLDISSCNYVVCFDTPTLHLKSYIQRKGRARSNNSTLILFSTKDHLKKLQEYEKILNNITQKISKNEQLNDNNQNIIETYNESFESSLGAKITEHSSKGILNHYISLLPSDEYYSPSVHYENYIIGKENTNTIYRAKCILPLICTIDQKEFYGKNYLTKRDAESSAALAVCKQLYKEGILNEHLLPYIEMKNYSLKIRHEEEYNKKYTIPCNIGHYKLSNFWKIIPLNIDNISLYKTDIIITGPSIIDSLNISFLSINNISSDYIIDKSLNINFYIKKSEKIILSQDELYNCIKIHNYLELVFFKTTGKNILKNNNYKHIQDEYIYLMCLSNYNNNNNNIILEPKPIINYNNIDKLKEEVKGKILYIRDDPILFFYYVEQVNPNLSPQSIINNKNISFYDYYINHYNLYSDNNQPLIHATKLAKRKNFMLSKLENHWKDNKQISVIPQHCNIFPLSANEYKACQVFSLALWELNHIFIVQEFLEYINTEINILSYIPNEWDNLYSKNLLKSSGCVNIHSYSNKEINIRILQMALTSPNVSENFNYELLETIGDSYLKYKASEYIFFAHYNQHEGFLNVMKAKIISNNNLFKLALNKNLQSYILLQYNGKISNINDQQLPIHKKLLADVVESLIAAFFLIGGNECANIFLKWIGIPTREYNTNNMNNMNNNNDINDNNNIESNSKESQDIKHLENIFNYSWKNISLLQEARTHISFAKRVTTHKILNLSSNSLYYDKNTKVILNNSNKSIDNDIIKSSATKCFQRLEFLGDAILDFLVTMYFISKYLIDLTPHTLSILRSRSVSNITFAETSMDINLHKYILHRCKFIKQHILNYEQFRNSLKNENSKKRFLKSLSYKPPKILADIFEAFTASIYIDCGFDTTIVWNSIYPLLHSKLDKLSLETVEQHPTKILHSLEDSDIIFKKIMEVERDNKNHIFTFSIFMNNEELYSAQDSSKVTSSVKASIGLLNMLFNIVINALFY